MEKAVKGNSYHNSFTKTVFDLSCSVLGLIISSPLLLLIVILQKNFNHGPILFKQIRVGKNGKPFQMIKFRTMKVGAEKLQRSLSNLNEADGPVFKILNDPRFTKFGKILAKTGLDELPQLINVLKSEMSIVGPRPLPVYEAEKLTKEQKVRELVLPGITSAWVVNGSHRLSFAKWISLDKDYVQNASFAADLGILGKTVIIMVKQTVRQTLNLLLK